MAVKQATVVQESLQWSQLPKDWPTLLKEDWQNKTNGINEVAEVANEANVKANNVADKDKNQDKAIELNRKSINTLSENVGILNQKTSANSQQISANAKGVSDNKQGVAANKQEIDTHTQSNSAHGVTGNNVGTGDYAHELVGGVVLLASALSEITSSFAPVEDAPDSYDKAHIQSLVDAVNSLGSKQGDIITLLNQVISTQVTAKQRATNAIVGGN